MSRGNTGVAVDRETALAGAPAGDKSDLRLWLRMLSCVSLIETRIRRRLREHFATTVPRFDLLAQLERAPEGLTLGQVSRRMMVTNGNITALAAGLVADGLVERRTQENDRRTHILRLTPHGRAVFACQSAAHEQWIIELFADVPSDDRARLHALLGAVKGSARVGMTEEAP